VTKTRKKRLLTVGLAAAVLGIAAFAVMAAKDQTYVPSDPYSPRGTANREFAVVYYSRSGHSEAAAREIVKATLNEMNRRYLTK
jgi:hypothetical protein